MESYQPYCCPSCQIFGAVRFEPNRSFLDSPRERRHAVHVRLTSGTSSSNREEERPPEPTYHITGFGSRAGTTNCDASGLGGFVRRYLSTRNLELQRMFEHSNIIRLRFSRTNFFYERTFVDARWSVFGVHTAERSFGRGLGLARGSHARMAQLLKSCLDACRCHVPEISRESLRSGNLNFHLEEKRERQSF